MTTQLPCAACRSDVPTQPVRPAASATLRRVVLKAALAGPLGAVLPAPAAPARLRLQQGWFLSMQDR
jgi:hypothetical protein